MKEYVVAQHFCTAATRYLRIPQQLVWSGASSIDQRSCFDFRVAMYNATPHLTYIFDNDPTASSASNRLGAGIILDNSYQRSGAIHADGGKGFVDIHEFNIVNEGSNALMITETSKPFDLPSAHQPAWTDYILDPGFQEIGTGTGQPLFRWKALDHISPSESSWVYSQEPNAHAVGWDWL